MNYLRVPTVISALFILNLKGNTLNRRHLQDPCHLQNPDLHSPIITLGSTSFGYIRHQDIFPTAVNQTNVNPAIVFELLYCIINLAKSYFGQEDEEAVKNNFVMIYELLDEILDFGYP
ncbi:hypothetical protein PCANC_03463 [Puccinia coronata f. sp. avenae]|uniref:AP complex mu/sigma subunit domain-containing protein n=1 Tax=Puccinia coronata f. sp. avenae TaxID=200324 RepID=A0A2N5W2G1_9BASI|nr:hypothetical protein PCANC_03463 [Puccinia coronata f. sp. avenae]